MSQRGSTDQMFRHEPPHVAQQSRRDKLRVQQRQFVVSADGNPNPNPNNINPEELIYNCSGMLMASSSGILDFTAGGGGGHDSSSCDWIMNQISGSHPLTQSHLYHLPEETSTNLLSLTSSHQNTLQAMVPSTSSLGLEMAGQITPWVDRRQEPLKVEGGNFSNAAAISETRGLSLSLASKPQFDVGFPNCPSTAPKFLVDARRSVGPLGPFTGYAAILKSSKFLRPAQQLLDEFCSVVRNSTRGSGGHCERLVGDDGNNNCVRGGYSGVLSSSFYSSTEGGNGGEGGGGNCSVQKPEIQQKKVKLLYLQEEVSDHIINWRLIMQISK